ncbi:hypothetical protein SELMODRAFT_412205 [Selaginella moellendorffii]|uniref:Uncharacterized protein n=1 Tax=Selaginella moellendorffii TaxID=88036 RepID=D8RKF1_SELML|nr:hypothetical protein SELMODRAFT_412205 [Selaginella moellendorffii]
MAKLSNAAEWTQWSESAESVHRVLSDLLAAAKNAKELSGGVSQVFEARRGSASIQRDRRHADSQTKGDASATLHSGVGIQEFDKIEQLQTFNALPVASPAPVQAPAPAAAPSMKVTKVKQSQKSWKLSQMKSTQSNAVMFPNPAYETTSPPSSKHFRVLAPFKHPAAKKTGVDKAQKVPLLRGKKGQTSPVKSLPALIDRLPSKNKPVTRPRLATETVTYSLGSRLPVPPAHFSRGDKHSEIAATGHSWKHSNPRPLKVLEASKKTCKDATQEKRQGVGRGQHYSKLSKNASRAKSTSPKRRKHSEKENLLTSNTSLRRSWSAGNGSLGAKNNNPGHSMLERAKGWMLRKQQRSGDLAVRLGVQVLQRKGVESERHAHKARMKTRTCDAWTCPVYPVTWCLPSITCRVSSKIFNLTL